jgi:Tol biopolymer transport system component
MNVDGTTETLANLGLDIFPYTPISLSPNQRQITLNLNGRGEGSELYMSNLDGTGLIHLTEADDSFTFGSSWSPDGTRLVLISGAKARYSRLYVVNADGSNRQLIGPETIELPVQDPIWLSDGQRILFMGVMQGFWELFLIQADGANLICLTCAMGADITTLHEHIVSANGQQFVYQSGKDIYIRDVAGGEPRKLTANLDKDVSSPTWSPDEQRILFGAFERDSGNQSIYLVNPDGSNLSELPIPAWDIVWSPDGQKFAFATFEGLFVGNLEGTQPLKLVSESFSAYEFDWSPDGQQLIFPSRGEVQSNETDSSDNYYNVDFYVVQADGSQLTRLTQTLTQKIFIGWLPD